MDPKRIDELVDQLAPDPLLLEQLLSAALGTAEAGGIVPNSAAKAGNTRVVSVMDREGDIAALFANGISSDLLPGSP